MSSNVSIRLSGTGSTPKLWFPGGGGVGEAVALVGKDPPAQGPWQRLWGRESHGERLSVQTAQHRPSEQAEPRGLLSAREPLSGPGLPGGLCRCFC